jgi:membrane-associated HD superfamily phosphohydrolase
MFGLLLILNLLALGALFTNHRLAAMVCFLCYSAFNLFFLFQANPTDLDPVFFAIMTLSSIAVYAALSAHSRDQTLTHQKKRASFHLLIWSLILAFFFGHWLLALHKGNVAVSSVRQVAEGLQNGEAFMLLAVVVLWFVGKNLYDRR